MAIGIVGGLAATAGKSLIGGDKTSKPKTIAGKLLGKISGRTKNAAEAAQQTNMIPGVSGSVAFGKAQSQFNFPLMLAIVAGVVMVLILRKPARRGRRR